MVMSLSEVTIGSSLVPHFMIPATHQVMEAYCKKLEFDVQMADGGGKLSFISVSLKLVRPFVGQCRV
jgi:hypothetical protein